ncbi:MAG: preprotein translocase subunit YajC [Desulfobacteraceae bacterium]|nr:preprotein translocase subunit YajC [Desulfobacteraceae bacterium]
MDIAFANDGAAGLGQFFSGPLMPIILMFGIMWFLLIRPQQKKQKEHKALLENLKKGDKIITSGGLHGSITGLSDSTLTVEIADRVRVKINRAYVAGLAQTNIEQQPAAKNKDKDKK